MYFFLHPSKKEIAPLMSRTHRFLSTHKVSLEEAMLHSLKHFVFLGLDGHCNVRVLSCQKSLRKHGRHNMFVSVHIFPYICERNNNISVVFMNK